MAKGNNAPSLNWNPNNHIQQSKEINKQNNIDLEHYKAQTVKLQKAKEKIENYRTQGYDVSDWEKQFGSEAKALEVDFFEKLGVIGRNVGRDYVGTMSKALGGNLESTYSQKMDEAKEEREQLLNPVSTIATEVLLDPGTYAPVPFVKGSTKLAQFGKNAVSGGAVSGALYTAKEGGDENYDPTDSLIAAGFGGALNGLIATALGKATPKSTKDAIREKAIKETDPVVNETFEENVIKAKDDDIVNKMMGKQQVIPEEKPSIFGFDKHSKVTENKVNYELVGESKINYPKHNNPEMQQVKVSDDINANLNMLSNKRIKKNDENIKYYDTPEKIEYLINKALGKPTHKIRDSKSGYNMITNSEHKNNPTVFIDDNNSVKKWVKSAYNLRDEQLANKIKEASSGSVAKQTATSAPTSSNEDIITNRITKSQDKTIYSSPTVSGTAVGGISGTEVDYDGDGKQSINDVLIGAVGGGVGVKALTKIKDAEISSNVSNRLKSIANNDFVDAFTGHKIYQKKDYMSLREDMINSKNTKMEDFAQLHEQLKLISDDSRNALHKYISGERNVNLSPSLKEFGDSYISQIEKQGKDLVDLGILDEAQYDKFKGKYLHRVYEKDITKEFSNYFTKGKTIPGVHTRGREWTGTKTEYEKYLEQDKIGDFFGGKIEARKLNNGKYKFTQDWTAEQRHKWGEIEDIAYTLPETLMRMSEMAEHGKMLSKFARQNNHVSDEAIDGYTQLQGKRYGALSGKYVSKDIADDINEFNRTMFGAEDGAIFSKEVKDAFRSLSTFWKKSHTVYNPTAHLNNLLSNVTMQYMQGVNPVKAIINAKRGAQAHSKLGQFRELTAKTLVGLTKDEADKLKALTLDEDLQLYMQADKAGLFGRSKLNDILNQYVSPTKNKSKVPNGLKKIDDVTSNLYQGEDNIMRFSLLKSLVDKGKSFDEAIKEVNSTIPDYTKPMSRMARFGRNSMLTPFISWTYYSTPIILRQLKERPGRAVALLGALYGINKMFGIDPYDNKDIPQKNFSMKRIPIYKDGKEVTTIKVDRWIPHNEILSPHDFVKNLTNGGAWKGGYEVLNNQNLYYGGKITYNEGARKAYDISKYVIQQISPDVIDKVWNLTESAIVNKKTRTKHPVTQPRSTVQELLNIAGVNTLTYDKKAQRRKAINERLK